MAAIRTTCPYCGVGCGVLAEPKGAREVKVQGDAAHPANEGRLCSKGTWLGQTVGLEGRLLHPEIGGKQVGWDEALDDVAARLRDTLEEHGPEAIGFYVSGQLLTEDYYVANKLAKGFLGTANFDTNSRLCMASAVAAHNRAFGEDVVPCTYEDLDCADVIVLVGSNTAWCHPIVWQRIERARERRGTKLVVVDPRRTETAALADLHIPVAPDGDVALFCALLADFHARGLTDPAYIADHCDLPEGYLESLDSAAHGIDPRDFDALIALLADQPRTITLFSQGANQSVSGTDKGNAIINFHLATGRINRMGAGPFSITGQPNAMGGREVGGLANTLACHLAFSARERALVQDFWQASDLAEAPGLKAVDLFRAVHDGRIKFLWIMATNPAVSMPDAGFVREALEKCPNVVVSDIMANTDTGKFADVKLPALGWGEKDGTVTNSDRTISRQRAVMAPPGAARADWRIVRDVAQRLGFGEAFGFASAADVFREYAAMTRLARATGKVLDLTSGAGCSDAEYLEMEPFRWGGDHPFKDRFSTPNGKAQIVPVAPHDAAEKGGGDFPLILNTGRYRDQWHTMTRTGLSPMLSQHRREPLVEVSEIDAEAHRLTDGGLATLRSAHGVSIYRVAVTDAQRVGEIFVPMHFTDTQGTGGRTGRLVHPLVDPHSGQPGFKNVPVAIEAYRAQWRAFLLSRKLVAPDCAYSASARIEGGWLTELAGEGAFDADALLPEGARQEVADTSRGMLRIAVRGDKDDLLAILYVTRSGTLPERGWIEKQFADPDAEAVALLAGRPSTPMPYRGKLVCVCHDVGEKTILEAVRNGADSVKAVGAATCAGTNCGSCRPIISGLLKDARNLAREDAQ